MSEQLHPVQAPRKIPRWLSFIIKLGCLLALGLTVGWTLNRISDSMERSGRPAGFERGLIQGLLMPMALPNLVMGKDVNIYSPVNTGRKYKLGYTLGVNVCGLVFFSYAFWRVKQFRKT